MKKPNLSNFGKKLKFSKRVEKNEILTEEEIFVETMTMLSNLWNRSNEAYERYKINLLEYEEQFYQVIEGFILLKYGLWKTEIILWYIFARQDLEGNVAPLMYKSQSKETEEVILKTPSELWNFIKRIEDTNPETE